MHVLTAACRHSIHIVPETVRKALRSATGLVPLLQALEGTFPIGSRPPSRPSRDCKPSIVADLEVLVLVKSRYRPSLLLQLLPWWSSTSASATQHSSLAHNRTFPPLFIYSSIRISNWNSLFRFLGRFLGCRSRTYSYPSCRLRTRSRNRRRAHRLNASASTFEHSYAYTSTAARYKRLPAPQG
jgi:hypothetical protein